MATDLDEMFAALSRQADEIPLAPAATARRRGRERTRNRAILSAAAAVLLLAVGAGVALAGPRPHTSPPAEPPASAAPVTGPPLPDVGAPVSIGDAEITSDSAATVTDGVRAYTAWRTSTAGIRMTAVDLHTGARRWPLRDVSTGGSELRQVVAGPAAVLVVAGPADPTQPPTDLWAFVPDSGVKLWEMHGQQFANLVFADRMLVWLDPQTGTTKGFYWTNGTQKWSLPAAGDRAVRALGMSTPADEARVNAGGLPADFADNRFVEVTAGGIAQVRDVSTGQLLRSTAVGPSATGSEMVTDDGWLYTRVESARSTGAQHVRASDLVGDGGSAVVFTAPAERQILSVAACGPRRVCVSDALRDRTKDGRVRTTAVDARTHHQIWQVSASAEPAIVSSAHGRLLLDSADGGYTLIDSNGKVLLDHLGNQAVWLDADTVLVPAAGNELAKWSAATGRSTPLGSYPGVVRTCASTADRLVCPTEEGLLHTWRVG
jgi:hypothetical protein